jgi:hypothetical protein
MKRKKLVGPETRVPLDIDCDNRAHFSGHRHALAAATPNVLVQSASATPAAHGANVNDALLGFHVCLVANHGHHVAAPTKKFGVVAGANNFLGLVVNGVEN